ncbi:MAG: ABC transporter permease [Alphaproteobacteria bacterium]|nr:ABC transporter permease [Alphaproteobacteria bacterium]
MRRFLIRRLLSAIVIVWAVATIVFFSMRIIPADPAEVVLGEHASAESLAAFRRQAGLDQPLLAQYWDFISRAVVGDLGQSLVNNAEIAPQIWFVLPYTVVLAFASLGVGILIGIPIGVLAAVRRNSWIDLASRCFALLGFSFPAFYLGVALLLLFSIWLGWFPVMHSIRFGTWAEHLYKLVLPALSLGLIQAAYITRLTRSTMLEELRKDYVRTALAKGLTMRRVLFNHGLRNALVPIVTAIGLYAGSSLGGAILTETVFNRPGLGKLLVGAIAQRDYNLIQAGLIVFALVIVAVNLAIDLSYGFLDPRVKHD